MYPVLSCREAAELEARILEDDAAEWGAMQKAGVGIFRALCQDYQELFPLPEAFNLLALVGKGHNGGDALIVCWQILKDFPASQITLILTVGVDELKPLAKRAYDSLEAHVEVHPIKADMGEGAIQSILGRRAGSHGFDICIDGLLGMSFKPPLRQPMDTLIRAVNSFDPIRLRAAVDLPSGKGDASDELFFRTDFTYATGIPKEPLFSEKFDCGRLRVLDLGFCKASEYAAFENRDAVLAGDTLKPVQVLRPANVNKYTYGHVFIVGGSATMPGALLMAVKAAVRSGAGLVTAFAPCSCVAALAAQVPEAMWVPCPEEKDGSLSADAIDLFFERSDRATAVLIGPGMGKGKSAKDLIRKIVEQVELPTILDADALRQEVVQSIPDKRKSVTAPVILTPHAGEFVRMAELKTKDVSNRALRAFCQKFRVTTVLKGPTTRICRGDRILYSVHGGPVLSRGGSGDLLAGLIGGMVAQKHLDVFAAVSCATNLHGLAAERLARKEGQVCVHTTQLLDYLPEILRHNSC